MDGPSLHSCGSVVGTTRQTMLVGCTSVQSSQSYLKNPDVYACVHACMILRKNSLCLPPMPIIALKPLYLRRSTAIILRCEVVSTTANCVGCNIEGRRQRAGTLERRLCNNLCPQHFLVVVTVLHLTVCCQAVLLVRDSC